MQPEKAPPKSHPTSRTPRARGPIHALVGCALAAILLNTWFVEGLLAPHVVSGPSMAPALSVGQRLLIDRAAFCWRAPRRWETVVFHSPDDLHMLCVKRVVGLPGETIEIDRGEVLVDGTVVRKNLEVLRDVYYIAGPGDRRVQYRLRRAEYFLLGDNSARSLDGRQWASQGGVTADMLVGPALAWY
ncbi:MAG: signal peptidase I [Pirellulales bacterium]